LSVLFPYFLVINLQFSSIFNFDFLQHPDSTSFVIAAKPLAGDDLEGKLQSRSNLSILGIEFVAQHCNCVNGQIPKNNDKGIVFKVDQSFGNYPQYIKLQEWWKQVDSSLN
jgi:uncharacterized protein